MPKVAFLTSGGIAPCLSASIGGLIEKYNDLAREALSNGDKILSKNYFQHAEHFIRVLEEKDAQSNKGQVSKEIVKENEQKNQVQNNTNGKDSELPETKASTEN